MLGQNEASVSDDGLEINVTIDGVDINLNITDLCRRENEDGTIEDRCPDGFTCIPGDPACDYVPIEALQFYEAVMYGIVEGIVAYFSETCHDGLFGWIYAAFRLVDHWKIWYPWNLMKFNMSINALFEANNIVYTYCDLTHVANELADYIDYKNWEQYIALAARISGVMIWDFWVYFGCITEGRAATNGWDVGLCAARITSLMIDTLL